MHKKASELAPDIEKIIAESMKKQSEAEKKANVGIDEAAHASADALGKITALKFSEKTAEALYSIGYMVGRFVYILDAADDLESDIKSGSFNPFKYEFGNVKNTKCRKAFVSRVQEMLNLTHSNALDALDTLEKKKFEDILENIVFDGLAYSQRKVLSKYSDDKESDREEVQI